ncbi:MAG: hypothetical protein M3Z37_06450 [Candidatus Eremiobacteraeota bacterium]|nr:hypothetical protein [Candidatus Eremiobacteraeota bacterium]
MTESEGGAELVVFQTADIHSRRGFGGRVARLATLGSLLVDCGDALAGSSTLYQTREPVADELNAAPYQAIAVGNREFHYAYGALRRRAQMLRAPLLCSNLIDLRGRPSPFQRELRLTVAGLHVRLLALLVPQYRRGSGWEKLFGWRFLPPDEALAEMHAGAAEADVTLLLSHLGLAADRDVALRSPFLTAILGGHSHDLLEQPELVNGIPIVHVGAYASYVGRLALRIEAGRLRSFAFTLLPLLSGGPS